MTREQARNLLKFLEMNYPSFYVDGQKIDYWHEELKNYDADDVKQKLKKLMSEEKYQYTPPLLAIIKNGLTQKENKLNLNNVFYCCHYCGRRFKEREELEEHQDRCSSVKYIERQYKRFNLGVVDNVAKAKLYALSEEEFDERYKKLLRIVQERTNDELEKTRIEIIFNPPSLEKAKRFIEREVQYESS